jgi:hypothetical protein
MGLLQLSALKARCDGRGGRWARGAKHCRMCLRSVRWHVSCCDLRHKEGWASQSGSCGNESWRGREGVRVGKERALLTCSSGRFPHQSKYVRALLNPLCC